jgi:hypothetical protein
MKFLPVLLSLFSAATAFIAAYIWMQASNARSADYTELGTEPETPETSYGSRMRAARRGAAKSGELNKKAAYWAWASSLLSIASAAVGLWLLF